MSQQVVYNFDEIIDRENTNSCKFDAVPFMNPDLPDDFISMWVADQDFACAPPILEAMKKRIDRRILGYSVITDPEYYPTVAAWMKRRHDWDVRPSTFTFTAGVVNAVGIAIDLLTKEGDGVILNTPAYHPFEDVPKKKGRKLVFSKLNVDDKGYYTVNYKDLEEKCKDPNNKVFILCNPHNPTGRVWKEEELRKIADICFLHDKFVISDEIHSDLIRVGQKHIPLAKLYPNEKRLIVCTAPSKTFNLACNQLSNIHIPDREIRKKWNEGFRGGFPNPLSVEACKAAYNQCESWLDQLKVYLDGNFKLLSDRLHSELPQAVFSISEGTYLAWIDFSKLGFNDDELKKRITRAGVFVEYASDFVADGEYHIRVNLSCPRQVLNEAITRIINSLKGKYVAPQFEGQLEVNDKFPIDKIGIKNEIGKKTAIFFLRFYGCPVTQVILKNIREKLQEQVLMNHPDTKVIVYVNSSEENYKKLNGADLSSLPFTLKFDLKGEIYKELNIRPAKEMKYLLDPPAKESIELAEDVGIKHLGSEPESCQLQRPATFIIDDEGKVLYSKYGHGAASVASLEELNKLL
ncbi:hypothetical protein M9Y10_025668 [Tritrichomonas musculus]|uniref:cysteine-S-conjugate beta-lyase n=1 Tax=Tritrichomonas musculus TaxID=1915356 RepID=A0ABR2HAM5_9EUKA